MENSGEAADDEGSGWFEVKKVQFVCSFFFNQWNVADFDGF